MHEPRRAIKADSPPDEPPGERSRLCGFNLMSQWSAKFCEYRWTTHRSTIDAVAFECHDRGRLIGLHIENGTELAQQSDHISIFGSDGNARLETV